MLNVTIWPLHVLWKSSQYSSRFIKSQKRFGSHGPIWGPLGPLGKNDKSSVHLGPKGFHMGFKSGKWAQQQCWKFPQVRRSEADNFGGWLGTFCWFFFNFIFMIWDSRHQDLQLFQLSFKHCPVVLQICPKEMGPFNCGSMGSRSSYSIQEKQVSRESSGNFF